MSADPSGRWAGHYTFAGRSSPLTAALRVAGGRLTGTMTDGQPRHEYTLAEAAAANGYEPDELSRYEAEVRAAVPDLPPGPITLVTALPADACLAGTWDGETVTFRKTYCGPTVYSYRAGGADLWFSTASLPVEYEGRLTAGGEVLEGFWQIDTDPAFTGRFELRRAGPGEVPPPRPWWRFWG